MRKTHIQSQWGKRWAICGTAGLDLQYVSSEEQDLATCAKCNPPNPPMVVLTMKNGRKVMM